MSLTLNSENKFTNLIFKSVLYASEFKKLEKIFCFLSIKRHTKKCLIKTKISNPKYPITLEYSVTIEMIKIKRTRSLLSPYRPIWNIS